MSDKEIKATVVHQFGHALGLGHALMKPEVWDILKDHVNIEEMKRSYGAPAVVDFDTLWTGNGLRVDLLNYDEESVMQYRYIHCVACVYYYYGRTTFQYLNMTVEI